MARAPKKAPPAKKGKAEAARRPAESKPKRKMGRPTSYTEEIAEKICILLAEGDSLLEICAAPDIPDYSTVMRWVITRDDFYKIYARAREAQPEAFLDRSLGDLRAAKTKDEIMAEARRLEALIRLAEKLAPKKYGNRLELAGSVEMKMTDDELESRAAELIRKAGARIAADGNGAAKEEEAAI